MDDTRPTQVGGESRCTGIQQSLRGFLGARPPELGFKFGLLVHSRNLRFAELDWEVDE